jgi:hypothetical protein
LVCEAVATLVSWTVVMPPVVVVEPPPVPVEVVGGVVVVVGGVTVVVIGPLSTLVTSEPAVVAGLAVEAEAEAFEALSTLLPAPHADRAAQIARRRGREV